MASQQFCLKWNNHATNMTNMFSQSLHDQNFADVTLACEGKSLKAHKMVISASSNYLKELLLANPCKHPIIILKDIKFVHLKAIISFMYRGEVNVAQHELSDMLKTAEMLKVKGLTEVSNDKHRENDRREDLTKKSNANLNEHSNKHLASALTHPSNEANASLTRHNQNTSSSPNLLARKKRRISGNNKCFSIIGDHDDKSTEDNAGTEVSGIKTVNETPQDNQYLVSTPNTNKTYIPNRAKQDESQINEAHYSANNQSHSPEPTAEQSSQTLDDISESMPLEESQSQSDLNRESDLEDNSQLYDICMDESKERIRTFNDDSQLDNSNNIPSGSNSTQTGKMCNLCHLTFTTYSSLRRHMLRHYADRERHQCDICFKTYARKDYLKEHRKIKHQIG